MFISFGKFPREKKMPRYYYTYCTYFYVSLTRICSSDGNLHSYYMHCKRNSFVDSELLPIKCIWIFTLERFGTRTVIGIGSIFYCQVQNCRTLFYSHKNLSFSKENAFWNAKLEFDLHNFSRSIVHVYTFVRNSKNIDY